MIGDPINNNWIYYIFYHGLTTSWRPGVSFQQSGIFSGCIRIHRPKKYAWRNTLSYTFLLISSQTNPKCLLFWSYFLVIFFGHIFIFGPTSAESPTHLVGIKVHQLRRDTSSSSSRNFQIENSTRTPPRISITLKTMISPLVANPDLENFWRSKHWDGLICWPHRSYEKLIGPVLTGGNPLPLIQQLSKNKGLLDE